MVDACNPGMTPVLGHRVDLHCTRGELETENKPWRCRRPSRSSGRSFVVGWTGEITVQYEGEAQQPEGAALAHYQEVYFANWPDGPSRLIWPGITYFVVWPRWIRYSDFDQNPPFIEELAVAEA